jgi:hypothetical protein
LQRVQVEATAGLLNVTVAVLLDAFALSLTIGHVATSMQLGSARHQRQPSSGTLV